MYQGQRSPAFPRRFPVLLAKLSPVFEINTECLALDNGSTLTSLFLLTAVKEALAQANLPEQALSRSRVGVCIGTTVGCTLNNEPFYRDYKTKKNPGREAVVQYLNNDPALYLAGRYGLKGPVATIANACSSGTDALGLAKAWLDNDWCDIAIAGGTDELSRITYLGFSSMLITSEKACRPFDKERSGLNLGEGAGVVILEKEVTFKKRTGTARVALSGYGCAADAYHPTAPHPEGKGLRQAIRQALTVAGMDTSLVGLINAHGTSTPNNDKAEGKTIGAVYPPCPVVSTKAYTGHTLGAAGGLEAVFTVQALLDQKLPATLGFAQFDEECGITPTTSTLDIKAEVGVSHSLAFGGNNSVLVFRRVN
jgi:3-oxoacyl-[acyl-carrier-protein] synthase-1/3-oxoacyl-[acyl-carrier-protein] synthase II